MHAAPWIADCAAMAACAPLVTSTSGAVPSRAREKAEKQLDTILRAGITTFICLQVRPSPRACVCLLDIAVQHWAGLSHTSMRCLHDKHQVPVAPGTHGLQGGGKWPLVPAYASVWHFIYLARSAADACLPATSSLPGQALLTDAMHLLNPCPSPLEGSVLPACLSAGTCLLQWHPSACSLPI